MSNRTVSVVATVATALVALVGASTAFAQEATPDAAPAVSIASRSVVAADAASALRAGTLPGGEAGLVADAPFTSFVSRAQVQAEAAAARRLGLLDRGELSAPVASAAQHELIRQAGLAARADRVAMVR